VEERCGGKTCEVEGDEEGVVEGGDDVLPFDMMSSWDHEGRAEITNSQNNK